MLVTRTVDWNILVGPTTEYIEDPDDTSTTAEGLREVEEKAKLWVPSLNIKKTIRQFAGIRARADVHDFIIKWFKS